MAMTMHVDIVSAEKELYSGRAQMVVASGVLGDLGIAPQHTPLITKLVPGPIRLITQDGGEENYFISGGFLEVQPDVVTVLADTAVRADDLDEAKAKEAKEAAEKALKDRDSDFDYSLAHTELVNAIAQLRAIEQLRKKTRR